LQSLLDEIYLSIKLKAEILSISLRIIQVGRKYFTGTGMHYKEIELLSELLKSIAHPIRLKILCLLQEREMTVGDIRNEVQTTHANVSQHLGILRSHGIIDFRKDANFIYNRISDDRMTELIKSMRRLFCEQEDSEAI
jgi:ArsR family transcriptional regulator